MKDPSSIQIAPLPKRQPITITTNLLSIQPPMNPVKLISLFAACSLAAPVFAGTVSSKAPATPPPVEDNGLWFRTVSYGWVTAIEGDVSIGRLSAPVDISMSDTLDSLDMAYMGVFEAGCGRFSAGVEVIYAKTSQDAIGGGRFFDSFRYEQKQWILTPFLAMRVIDTGRYHMDVFAGARFTLLEAELTGRLVGPGEISATRDIDWVDPIIGIRGQADFSDKWFFRYNGDVGGFGIGSDFAWQAFAGVGYHFTPNVSAALGYRGMGMDYSKGSFAMDTVSHGPVIGLEMRF